MAIAEMPTVMSHKTSRRSSVTRAKTFARLHELLRTAGEEQQDVSEALERLRTADLMLLARVIERRVRTGSR